MSSTIQNSNLSEILSSMNKRLSSLESKSPSNKTVIVTVGASIDKNIDFIDIQSAVDYVNDKGGGKVFIRNGTYTLTSDITLYNGVIMQGETREGVTLDFNGGSFQIKAVGDNAYTTGTISVNNRSTTITGSGTTWTAGMVGQTIMFWGSYFTIEDVVSATQITIDGPYDQQNISGAEYVICDPISDVSLENIVVANSIDPDGAVLFKYVIASLQDGVTAQDSTIGLNYLKCSGIRCIDVAGIYCGTGINIDNAGDWTLYDWWAYGCTTHNVVLNHMVGCSIANFSSYSSTGNGMYITNSDDIGISDFALYSNGGNGVEMDSCYAIQILNGNIVHNTGDGIKLNANVDRTGYVSLYIATNGAYGVRIANANCDKNTVALCHFTGNTSGTILDSGTGTINANNQT